ncbi:hypothetical protein [Salinispira pacifica]
MAEKKFPKPFRKPIEEGRYVRRVLNRVYLEPDREYLKSIFAADESGVVRPVRQLSDDELKRLKKLGKEVRRNRGIAQKGKLAVLLIIVVGVLLFDLVFKNTIVTRAGEQLLQNAFQARAELSGVDFRPLRGSISFSRLFVADRQQPMKNLFELGPTRLDIDTLRLLSGHLIISRMQAKGIRWGTARSTSGALEPARASGSAAASGAAARGGRGFSPPSPASVLESLDLPVPGSFDAKAFVEQHAAELKTVSRIGELSSRAGELTQSWTGRVAALAAEVQSATEAASGLSSIDVKGIRTLDAAAAAYRQVQTAGAVVSKTENDVQGAYRSAASDVDSFSKAAAEIPQLVSADGRYLASLVPDISTGGKQIMTRIVETYIRAAIGSWYDRLEQGYGVVSRLASERAAGESRKTRRLPGRTVSFPSAAYPVFWLKEASFDAADSSDSLALAGSLQSITSEPDLIDRPASFEFKGRNRGGSLGVAGTVDGRTGAEDRVVLSAESSGVPIDLSEGLAALDISSVSGSLALSTHLSMKAAGGAEGTVDLRASSLSVKGSYSVNSFGGILADVLQQGTPLEAAFDYRVAADGTVTFPSGRSNLDAVAAGVLRARAREITDALQTRVRGELDALVASRRSDIDAARAQVASVEKAVKTQLDAASGAKDQVASVQKELDARIAAIKQQAQNQAQQQLQDQLNSLQKGLKLPGLGQ